MEMRSLSAGHGALTGFQGGQGRDLVLLHSLFTDYRCFDAMVPALAPDFRVTVFNMPGYNGSEPAVSALLDAYIARIEDGFDEWGIAPDAVLFGNGIGATTALGFALAHPARVGRLILNGVALTLPEQTKAALNGLIGKFEQCGAAAIYEGAAQRFHSPGYLASHPQAVETVRRVIEATDPKSIVHTYKILQAVDFTADAHRIELPVQVLVGAADQATPPALNKAVAEKIPRARYAEIRDAGHCPAIEQPQALLAAIKDFAH